MPLRFPKRNHRLRFFLGIGSLFALLFIALWLLSPQTRWRYSSPLPAPRAMYVSATLSDGTILFGEDTSTLGPRHYQIYDPKTDSWTVPKNNPDGVLPNTQNHIDGSFWEMITQCEHPFTVIDGDFQQVWPSFTSSDAAAVRSPLHRPDGTLFWFEGQFLLTDSKEFPLKRLKPPPSFLSQRLNTFLLPSDRLFWVAYSNLYPTHVEEAIYSFKTDSWLILSDPKGTIGQTCTLLPDGKILAIGGACYIPQSWISNRCEALYDYLVTLHYFAVRPTGNYPPVTTCRLYDPATNTWSITQPLNTPRAFHTANLLPNGRILVSGGYTRADDNATTATCEIIDLKEIDP